jgi:hypothetical protein
MAIPPPPIAFAIAIVWLCLLISREWWRSRLAVWGGDIGAQRTPYFTGRFWDVRYPSTSWFFPMLWLWATGLPWYGSGIYINYARLHHRWSYLVLGIGGVIPPIAFSIFLMLPWLFGGGSWLGSWLPGWTYLLLLTIGSIWLNLLPIPVLDGYRAIQPWLPLSCQVDRLEWDRYAPLGVAFFFYITPLHQWWWQANCLLLTNLGIDVKLAELGREQFIEQIGGLALIAIAVAGLLIYFRFHQPFIDPDADIDRAEEFLRTTFSKQQESVAKNAKNNLSLPINISLKSLPSRERKTLCKTYFKLQHFLAEQQYPQAVGLMTGARQRFPELTELKLWEAIVYQQWGHYLVESKKFPGARSYLQHALKLAPHNGELWQAVERDFQTIDRHLR